MGSFVGVAVLVLLLAGCRQGSAAPRESAAGRHVLRLDREDRSGGPLIGYVVGLEPTLDSSRFDASPR